MIPSAADASTKFIANALTPFSKTASICSFSVATLFCESIEVTSTESAFAE